MAWKRAEKIPKQLAQILSEVTSKPLTLPLTLSEEEAKALFERMGVKDFDPSTTQPDGRHCARCSDEECLPGRLFQIVAPEQCECTIHHS